MCLFSVVSKSACQRMNLKTLLKGSSGYSRSVHRVVEGRIKSEAGHFLFIEDWFSGFETCPDLIGKIVSGQHTRLG